MTKVAIIYFSGYGHTVKQAEAKQYATLAWQDKVAGGFTTSASVNGDKFNTITYFITLSQQHGQLWVGTGLQASNKMEHGPGDVNWTAGYSGALAIAPSDSSPDQGSSEGDLETARLYGARVATAAIRNRVAVAA